MPVSPGRLLAGAVATAALLVVSACASGFSAPWDAQRSGGWGLEARNAALEVRCDECVITFAVGGQSEEVNVRGLWTRRVSYYYRRGQIALTAVPTSLSSSVERARIIVDGSIVAEGGAGPGERVSLAAELRRAATANR